MQSKLKRKAGVLAVDSDNGKEKQARPLSWTLSNGVELCVANIKSGQGQVGKGSSCKTAVDWINVPGHIYCGRAMHHVKIYKASVYCNPYVINKKAADAAQERERVLCAFRAHLQKNKLDEQLLRQMGELKTQRPELKRIVLGCFCLPLECHTEQIAAAVVALDAHASTDAAARDKSEEHKDKVQEE